jgi:hypothetical protein
MKHTKLLYKAIRRIADGIAVLLVAIAALFAARGL